MTAISIENLEVNYDQNNPIFDNINLTISEHSKVGLIGANGSGKTTLFLSICGIITQRKGEIKLFNQVVKKGEFRSEIGLIFQNPDDQLFCSKVRDDVAFGPENMGLTPSEIDLRVKDAMQVTNTIHLADRIPHQLSGGEKCMVAIASVLSMNPKIILYDEPSANLDLKTRRRLINFLQSSQETIFVCSHDLELILEVCNRVIFLNKGKIIADGNPSIIMSDKILMETHNLEVPSSLLTIK